MNCQSHLYCGQDPNLITRRWFLQQCGVGVGSMALAALLGADKACGTVNTPTAPHPLAPKQPHFKPKATRVIYLFMGRSEEHTSELQSRFDLVCRLLLET